MRHRLVAGVLSLVTAGALTTVPYAVAAAPIDPIVNYAGQSCDVTLPGGATARVAEQGGHESAQILDAAAIKGGMFSIDSGGHQVLVPARKLTAGVNFSAYDTALLAQQQCGWNAPQRPARASGGYRLAPLTINTLDLTGRPAPLFVMLTNVDDQGLARPIPVDTADGVTKINVPVGHYAAVEIFSNDDLSHYWFVLDPEFTVSGDHSGITLDPRTATVTVLPPTTPLPSTLESNSFGVSRGDGVNAADWFDYFDLQPTPEPFSVNEFAAPPDGVTVINPAYEFSSPPGTASPYQYHITEPTDHVSGAFPATVDPAKLATVLRNYDTGQPGGEALSINVGQPLNEVTGNVIALRGFNLVTPGSTRTEYFSASPDLAWRSVVDGGPNEDELFSAPKIYLPGHTYTDSFHQGGEHPGVALDTLGQRIVCAACSTPGDLQFDIYPLSDNTPGHFAIMNDSNGSSSFQLSRNGSVIATDDTGPQFVGVSVPNGTATYQLTENDGRPDAPLSTTVQTTWTFTANPGHGEAVPSYWQCLTGEDCTTLPLLFADYTTDESLDDALTTGVHTLDLDVTHQQDAKAPQVTGASVAVSFDDGATWVPATVNGRSGHYAATFTVPATASGGHVSVRVSAWDAAGNRIDQTVQRAYAVTTR